MAIHKVLNFLRVAGMLSVLGTSASAQFVAAPAPYPFPFTIPSGGSPVSVVVGNFKAPMVTTPPAPLPVSTPDLAVLDQVNGKVILIFSNGHVASTGLGGFALGPVLPVGNIPTSMASGDFNQDGFPDLVVTNQVGGTVSVLLNDGNGWVNPTINKLGPFPGGVSPDFVATGDFNKDGYLDLAIVNRDSNNVTVLLGVPDGTFKVAPGSPFPVGKSPSSVAVADFDGDGIPDLAVTNELDNTVTVLLGNGDKSGGFHPAIASPFAVGFSPSYIVAADFNLDGNQDLAIANLSSSTVTVLLGNGIGNFDPSSASPLTVGTNPVAMAVADFNGDSIPDLAIANYGGNNVTVLLGNGAGGFKPDSFSPYAVGTSPRSVAVGDFNNDGVPDLAIANSGSSNVSMLLNNFAIAPVMVSAASFSASSPVAPGSLVSIFGTGLSALDPPLSATVSATASLPTCLDWIAVSLTDASGAKNLPLSLLYVSKTQIDAQVPQLAAVGPATFTISASSAPTCTGPPPSSSQTSVSQKGSVTVAAVAPSLFSADSTGKGLAVGEFIPDLGVGGPMYISTCLPMEPCTANTLIVSGGTGVLVLYGTGIRNRASLSAVTVTIGGQSLPAFYAGPSSDIPGADEVSVTLPSTLAGSGTVFVTVVISGTMSNQVTVDIQ
jgi:uncharacterized protein (TIGR03437 family)